MRAGADVVYVSPLEQHECADCHTVQAVRFFHDSECNGVHSCYLCDECSGLSRRGVFRGENGRWSVPVGPVGTGS